MARETLYAKAITRLSLPFASRTANATVDGTAVDMTDPSGGTDGFRSAMAVVTSGAITDGTHTVTLQESDTGSSGWAAPAAADVQGTNPAVLDTDTDNSVAEIGYTGGKRYLRLTVTTAGATSGGVFGGHIILSDPSTQPVQR